VFGKSQLDVSLPSPSRCLSHAPVCPQIYIVWHILAIVYAILIVVTSFVTVALTYFQLAVEDHAWWWRSFLCGGSTAFFVYAYAFYYYFYRSFMSGFMQAGVRGL
jgi:hypothetical protein